MHTINANNQALSVHAIHWSANMVHKDCCYLFNTIKWPLPLYKMTQRYMLVHHLCTQLTTTSSRSDLFPNHIQLCLQSLRTFINSKNLLYKNLSWKVTRWYLTWFNQVFLSLKFLSMTILNKLKWSILLCKQGITILILQHESGVRFPRFLLGRLVSIHFVGFV